MNSVRKTLLFLFVYNLFALAPSGLSAGWTDDRDECWGIEARVACFCPQSKTFRKIYANRLAQYQLEYSCRFSQKWCGWGNIGYSTDSGHSIGEHDRTNFNLWPFSTGLKYYLGSIQDWEAYLGAGVAYSYVTMTDHSPFVKRHIRKKCFGGVGKFGLSYTFWNCGSINLFVDYYYTNFHFSGTTRHNIVRNNLRMSGFLYGGGLGVQF